MQYDLHRKTAKISTLSSENVSKYEFLIGKDVLPEKDFLEKAAIMKKIWIFTFRERIKSINWYHKERVSKIRRYFWIW